MINMEIQHWLETGKICKRKEFIDVQRQIEIWEKRAKYLTAYTIF